MARAAARKVPVLLEAVDSNGLLPVRAPEEGRVFTRAYSFRRYLQKTLPDHLYDFPQEHPLVGDPLPAFQGIPDEMRERWPPTSKPPAVPDEPGPVSYGGGAEEGREVLEAFLERGLGRYADDRNDPDLDVPSGLSPWLHWGHISTHEVFDAVARKEGWNPGRLSGSPDGTREGWWGMSPGAEAFLDQLVTWRELGFNGSARMEDWERWESLPGVGPGDPGETRLRRAAPALHPGAVPGRQDPRRALERGPAGAPPGGAHPQLPPDALGKKDPGVEPAPEGRP
jgi:deoxyribodipyrimidine photo-lyase